MATLLLNNNNDLLYTVKSVIMQKSNLVDELNILIPKYYNNIDMSEYYVYMHYIMPISREHKVLALTIDNNNYTGTTIENDKVLGYKLPLTTDITMESGKLEVWLTFYKATPTIDENDELVLLEPYRVSLNCYIPITKASDYDNIMLSTIKGAYDAQITALQEAIKDIKKDVPVDVVLNTDKTEIHLINTATNELGSGINTTVLSNVVGSSITSDDEQLDNEADGIIDADQFEEV